MTGELGTEDSDELDDESLESIARLSSLGGNGSLSLPKSKRSFSTSRSSSEGSSNAVLHLSWTGVEGQSGGWEEEGVGGRGGVGGDAG